MVEIQLTAEFLKLFFSLNYTFTIVNCISIILNLSLVTLNLSLATYHLSLKATSSLLEIIQL
jgi:hypothetical protein